MVKTRCWEWHIDPECDEFLLFGVCPDCGNITSAVIPGHGTSRGDFVGSIEMSCQKVNDVAKSVPDGCGWRCQVYVDVPKRKAYYMREVCSREIIDNIARQ